MLYANDTYLLADYIAMAEVVGPILAICALGVLAMVAEHLIRKRRRG
jgi:hypothetical protein